MTSRLAVLVVAVSALLTACAHTADTEPKMTPDQARAELTKTIQTVLEAAAPGSSPDIDSSGLNDGIPCGGLEGNEFNKIKHGVNAVATERAADPETAIARISARLTALKYDNFVEPDDGYKAIIFSDAFGGGRIQVYQTGRVSVSAETECLDNPDR